MNIHFCLFLTIGWLTKRGHTVRNWKRRWFVLKDPVLAYYKSPRVKKREKTTNKHEFETNMNTNMIRNETNMNSKQTNIGCNTTRIYFIGGYYYNCN